MPLKNRSVSAFTASRQPVSLGQMLSIAYFLHCVRAPPWINPFFPFEVNGNDFYPSATQRYPAICEGLWSPASFIFKIWMGWDCWGCWVKTNVFCSWDGCECCGTRWCAVLDWKVSPKIYMPMSPNLWTWPNLEKGSLRISYTSKTRNHPGFVGPP